MNAGPPVSVRTLTIGFILLLIVVTAFGGAVLYGKTHGELIRLTDQRLNEISRDIQFEARGPGLVAISDSIARLGRKRDTADVGIELTDQGGRWVAGNSRITDKLPVGYSRLDRSNGIPGVDFGRALVKELKPGIRLTVFAETEPIDDYFAISSRLYIIVFGTIIAVMVAGLFAFRVLMGRRISSMRQAVDAIINGDLRHRIPTTGTGDEFDRQAEGFNRALDRIGELMEEMRSVTNDISHELRTPLAHVRGQLALISARDDAAPIRKDIGAVLARIDELIAMSGALLRIADISSGRRRAGFKDFDLGALVRETDETMSAVAQDSGHRLVLARCDQAPIVGDRHLLVQLTVNLLENALRHTPAGSIIAMSLEAWNGGVTLTVCDNGLGIPLNARDEAMRPFGRLERSRAHTGHGLGLPLVAAIVHLHGGTVRLEDNEPGLRVVAFLPIPDTSF